MLASPVSQPNPGNPVALVILIILASIFYFRNLDKIWNARMTMMLCIAVDKILC